jgi:hypothetical protein
MAGLGVGVLVATSLMAITPAAAADGAGFELLVVGDPYSPVPEPFASDSGYANIGLAFGDSATSISDIGGLTSDGNAVEITPTCTNPADPDNGQAKSLVQVELGQQLAYQYQVGGVPANLCNASEIESFQLTFTTNAASCLVSGRPSQLEAGTYPLTRTQVNNSDFGDAVDFHFNPLSTAYPAFRALKDGSAGTFTSVDVLGGDTDKWSISAYLPASRPCAPLTGPVFTGTNPFATNVGRLGVGPASVITQTQAYNFTTTIAVAASGGGGRYQETQVMAEAPPQLSIRGAKRIQALPRNNGTSGTSPWGGYRNDGLFVQCGANTNVGLVNTTARCRMAGILSPGQPIQGTGNSAPTLGVRVTNGGALSAVDSFNHWSAVGTNEVGQEVSFRARDVSWVGYGLHSPQTTVNLTDGN